MSKSKPKPKQKKTIRNKLADFAITPQIRESFNHRFREQKLRSSPQTSFTDETTQQTTQQQFPPINLIDTIQNAINETKQTEGEMAEDTIYEVFVDDDKYGLTLGRHWSRILSRYMPFYNPRYEERLASLTAHSLEQQQEQQNEVKDDPEESTTLLLQDRPTSAAGSGPSLEEAWAYFEHVTLPRRFVEDESGEVVKKKDGSGGSGDSRGSGSGSSGEMVRVVRAAPGEVRRPTKLYSPIWTSMKDLGDFGIGIGLYFYTLRFFALITFLAALTQLPNFIYFSSTDYSVNKQAQSHVAHLLQGSAICTTTAWVPCPTCIPPTSTSTSTIPTKYTSPLHLIQRKSILSELYTTSRIITHPYTTITNTTKGTTSITTDLYFALQNRCMTDDQIYKRGFTSWIGMMLVTISVWFLAKYQHKLEVEFDELNATSTDFSLKVTNPPIDAYDPEEWKVFFEKVCRVKLGPDNIDDDDGVDTFVTAVTVVLNNYELTDALVGRRKIKSQIMNLMDDDESLFMDWYVDAKTVYDESLDKKKKNMEMTVEGSTPKLSKLFFQLLDTESLISTLEKKRYDVTKIFVTFESEVGQRAALSALDVSKYHAWRQTKSALDDGAYLFRGEYILDVYEPNEPLTIRYRDLGVPFMTKWWRAFRALVFSILQIGGAFFVVSYVWHSYGAGSTGITIALLNMLIPKVCRFITFYEIHPNEGSKQASLNTKVTAFRWINSAIVIHLITPFASSLTKGQHLITAVSAIFIAEMWTAPMFQLLNIPGNIKRHLLAPRKKTQVAMNNCFVGGRWELAERYTEMMKILFMCFFFQALFPGSFILACVSLLIHYQVDLFCLTRVWAQTASLGSQVAELNRTVNFPILLIILSSMNAYMWSGFPFDNLCEDEENKVPQNYIGNHTLHLNTNDDENEPTTISIQNGDPTYHPCSQDFLRLPITFPPFPRFQEQQKDLPNEDSWMTPNQESIVNLHCYTSLAIVIFAFIKTLFNSDVSKHIFSFVSKTYEPSGEIYGANFTEVAELCDVFPAYVPQIKVVGFPHPLILCDIGNVHNRYVGWLDPNDPDHEGHNLFKDVSESAVKVEGKPIFSLVKFWTPPLIEEEDEEDGVVDNGEE